MLTAQELEEGGGGIRGRFGDGAGKWRLTVSADQPLQVMSLMQSATGHLTNLSRQCRRPTCRPPFGPFRRLLGEIY